MSCELCLGRRGEALKIVGHHLSYNPEVLMYLCTKCHNLMHLYSESPMEELNKVQEVCKQYGANWTNGTDKYLNSESYKEKRRVSGRKWRTDNLEKSRQLQRDWYHRVRKFNPEHKIKRKEWDSKRRKVNGKEIQEGT